MAEDKFDDKSVHVEKRSKVVHHGKNIKWWRKQKGLTQEQLANLLGKGILQQDISNWEKEEILSDKILNSLAKELQIGVDWLKDYIPPRDSTHFSQEGNGNNQFLTDVLTYTINHPIEAVKEAYQETSKIQEAAYNDSKMVYKEEIERLKNHNTELSNQLFTIIGKIGDKV